MNANVNHNVPRPTLPALPKLGTEAEWNEWFPRVRGQAICHRWQPQFEDRNAQQDQWPVTQQWLTQWVPFKDFHLIDGAECWIDAIAALKSQYCPMDRISVMNVMAKLWDIVPTSTDTPQDIITRAQEFSAQLRSIGHAIDDETLVAAIMKALNKVEAYKTVVGHLMYIGQEITIERLQAAFVCTTVPTIPGAHMASGSKTPPTFTPPPSANTNPYDFSDGDVSKISEALAHLSQKFGKLKGQIKKNHYNPNAHGRGGGGRGGGHQHGGGGRAYGGHQGGGGGDHGGRGGGYRGGGDGGFRGRGGRDGARACFNCGYTNHTVEDCRFPCGICLDNRHKATHCPKNPRSPSFVSPFQRGRGGYGGGRHGGGRGGGHSGGRSHGHGGGHGGHGGRYNANYVEGSTVDDGHGHEYAHMAQAFSAFQPFTSQPDPNLPPGIHPYEPMDMTMAPPDNTFMMIGKASKAALNHMGKREEWYMDSGATNHFCCERDMLHSFVPDDPMRPVYVRIADKTLIKRSGVGNIRSRTCIDGLWYNRELRGVWYVPEFHQNLLSLNKLKDAGCWMITGRQGDKNDYVMGSDDVLWLITKPNGGLNSPDWHIVRSFVPKTIPTPSRANLSFAPNASHAPSGILKPCLSKPYRAYRSSTPASFTPLTHPSFPNVVSPMRAPMSTPVQSPCHAPIHEPFVAPILQASYATPNVATDKESPELWHQRLGHTDIRGLIQLVKHKAINGVNIPAHALAKLRGKHCQVCIMSKHNRSPFRAKRERADAPMCVLHSDICGPYPIRSMGGSLYVLTLVDEYSGFCAVSLLKDLKKAHEELMRMIEEWESKTGKLCQKLFSDRGGLYVSGPLEKWCAKKNIKHDFSTPRTPEQNGKAERINQTLNNIMRALLFQYASYLPLWSHAMMYAALIYNISYSQRLDMTRHQAFTGEVPDVSKFCTFGCKVYARVADDERKKLDPKSQLGIFLGPEPKGHGYKVLVYDKNLKAQNRYQVHIVRDIVCFENLTVVTGAQDNSQLHWGGDIPLPTPQQVEVGHEPPEPLTGVPAQPLAVRFALPLSVGESRAVLPEVAEGRQAIQQGEQRVLRPRAGPNAAGPPLAAMPGVVGQAAPLQLPPAAMPSDTGPAAMPRPDAHPKRIESLVRNIVNKQPPSLQGSISDSRIVPSGRPIVRVASSSPITRIVHAPLRPMAPAKAATTIPRSVGVAIAGAKRKIAFMASSTAPFIPIDSEDPYDCLPQMYGTAFTASPPYPPPPPEAVASREELTEGLLRYFNVPTERTGPLPVISKCDRYAVPSTLKQAMASDYAPYWAEAVVEEWLSLVANDTWNLVKQEPWMKVIPCKWVFTIKTNAKGIPERFKARLVAGGHRQTEGIDYDETYAPVSRLATMRTMLSVAAHKSWEVHQIDVKNAFLHGDVDTQVYMRQPPGFVDGVQHVAKLNRSLYGLKQAPRIYKSQCSCHIVRD
jgi:transposase InsO family protein